MFYSASLAVDPSQVSHIRPIEPTKVFKRLLFLMTSGKLSEKEEMETLTAISVLQQIHRACRSIGIANLVRLSKDEVDFYFDEEGRKDDLKQVLDQFENETDLIESEAFRTLELVLEHEDATFKYLIEINVRRIHKVREYPIELKVNGVLKQFAGGSEEAVRKNMKAVFASNDAYEGFVKGSRLEFDQFVGSLEMALRASIKVDDICVQLSNKIVRPRDKDARQGPKGANRQASEPAFYGYYGYGDAMLYAWLWSSMCHDHNIHVQSTDIVDETGHTVMSVGDHGFDAGENNVLNPDVPLEESVSDASDFTPEETRNAFEDASFDSDSRGDIGGDFGGDSDGGSSCSSCGGGCGGD